MNEEEELKKGNRKAYTHTEWGNFLMWYKCPQHEIDKEMKKEEEKKTFIPITIAIENKNICGRYF